VGKKTKRANVVMATVAYYPEIPKLATFLLGCAQAVPRVAGIPIRKGGA